MQDAKWVIKELLDCGLEEVDQLLRTKIDIQKTRDHIIEEGLMLNYETLLHEAFMEKVCEVFDYGVEETDFQAECNGSASHFMIVNDKYDYYMKNHMDKLREIEDYMDMNFERGV